MKYINNNNTSNANYAKTDTGFFYLFLVCLVLISQATFAFKNNTEPLVQQKTNYGQVPNGLTENEWYSIKQQIVSNKSNTIEKEIIGYSSFQQQNYIKPFNTDVNDSFGFSVAISGNTMVVGAIDEDSGNGNPFSNSGSNSGAAYVFVQDTAGSWSQEAYLKASNTDAGDRFGWSVAIDGDFIVVGARNENSNATGVNGNQTDNTALNSGAAYVFSRIGGTWSQEAYLKASNTNGGSSSGSSLGDNFGTSVAISGDRIVVGAPDEDSSSTGVDGNESNNSASSSGAAYLFKRSSNGIWSQEHYLKASNTDAGDNFGTSVAISGGRIIIGASGESSIATGTDGDESNNSAHNSGAVYAFTNIGTFGGVWVQSNYLKASNTSALDLFGSSLSISDTMLIIGATGEDSGALNSGAAYVFSISTLPNSNWGQSALLKASNAGVNNFFGKSVSISGKKLVVGAASENSDSTGVDGDENNTGASNSGAAYVFVKNISNIWSQTSYLKSSNSEAADSFGGAVAISGSNIVVAANNEDGSGSQVDNNDTSNSGAIYAFSSTDEIWHQQRITKASNIDDGDRFGQAIAISETTLIVGAFKEDSASAGINGDESDNSLQDAGAAYVFIRNSLGNWVKQAYLKPSNPDANDWFGYSVAISGDTVAISARNERSNAIGINGDESNNFLFQAGAVYVFTRNNEVWSQQAYIKASNTGANDLFGFSLGVSGDTLVVGAVFEDSDSSGIDGDQNNDLAEHSGAAYVFERDSFGNWSQVHYLKASNNTGDNDEFGRAVSISDDLLVVSANREDGGSTGINGLNNNAANDAGAVYAFIRNNGFWTQEAYIKASNTGAGDEFGRSIALAGNTLVVGARHEDGDATIVNGIDNNSSTDSGAAYVFYRNFIGLWSQSAYLKPQNANSGDWFGDWVAVSGENLIVVGASREDSNSKNVNSGEANNSLNNSGAAYVFKGILGIWGQQTYLKASNSGDTDSFGGAVAISNATVVIGASLEDSSTIFADNNSSIDSGAIYIFNKSDLIFKHGFE